MKHKNTEKSKNLNYSLRQQLKKERAKKWHFSLRKQEKEHKTLRWPIISFLKSEIIFSYSELNKMRFFAVGCFWARKGMINVSVSTKDSHNIGTIGLTMQI